MLVAIGLAFTCESEAVAVRTLKQAVVVRDGAMGNTKLATQLAVELRKQGVQAELVTFNEIVDPNWWQQTKSGIVVLPNAKRLPAEAKEPLLDFLRQGGKTYHLRCTDVCRTNVQGGTRVGFKAGN